MGGEMQQQGLVAEKDTFHISLEVRGRYFGF